MESQSYLGIPGSFSGGYFVDVSIPAAKIELVCPSYGHCYHFISYFNLFPSPNLPLAGSATLLDFADADGNDSENFNAKVY
jgi:hypothetical protein